MCRIFAIVALSMFPCCSSMAQTITSASVVGDGRVALVFSKDTTRTIPAEDGQVGCENVRIALDRHTVAWSVLIENCCTSYPVRVTLVVYRDSKKVLISPGQMIWDWNFVGRGNRIAILSGPVHGWANAASLYDSHSGKLLRSWNGVGTVPEWARGWERQFESSAHKPT
jgi:hypothetical protein